MGCGGATILADRSFLQVGGASGAKAEPILAEIARLNGRSRKRKNLPQCRKLLHSGVCGARSYFVYAVQKQRNRRYSAAILLAFEMLLRHKLGCVSTLTTWFLKEYFAGIQVGRTRPLPQILGICRLNVEEGSVQNSAFAATGSLVIRPRRLLGMTSCAIPSLFLLILCLSFAAKPSRS